MLCYVYYYIMLESECLTLNIFISVLHLNVVDQLRNAGEDKATKILREKLKFTTSAKSKGGKVKGGGNIQVRSDCERELSFSVSESVMMFGSVGAELEYFGNPSTCSSAIIVEAGKVWPKQHITKDCRRGMSTFDEVWTKTRIITTLIAEFSFIDCPVIWA